jgi:hypothetical protein
VSTTKKFCNVAPLSRLSKLVTPHRQDFTPSQAVDTVFKSVFELLSESMLVTRVGSNQRFTTQEITEVFQMRLIATVTEWCQHDRHQYWDKSSTCPFEMPLGKLFVYIVATQLYLGQKQLQSM